MADRRTDDSPVAPRRPLDGPSEDRTSSEDKSGGAKPPLTERFGSALSSAGSAVASAASSGPGTKGGTSVTDPAPSRREEAKARRTAAKSAGSTATSTVPRPKGTRRARLRLVHLDPWSVMKTSFLLSIAFGIVTVVAVAVVWSVLGAAGVWESINTTVTDVMGEESGNTFDVQDYVGMSRVLGFTMIVAVVDVVLITAIATLAAFLYNLAAALLGGIEVTLAEDER